MKSIAVVAVSVLALMGSVAGAEARGFRLRGSGFSVPSRTVSLHEPASARLPAISPLGVFDPTAEKATIVTRSVMTTDGLGADPAADDGGPIPPMPPAPAPVAAKKPAQPWCPSGRIAGNGTGFCLIN